MDLEQITPLILTYNETPNIGRCLERLSWARRIVVVDSFSTDETLDILRQYPAVEVFQNPFLHFADQCNFGLERIYTEWVLSMDADYILSEALTEEIKRIPSQTEFAGYQASFIYCINGYPLRAALLPPRTVLYRRSAAQYKRDGHAHKVVVDGQVSQLNGLVDHDDRKPFSVWYENQKKYAANEVEKLCKTRFRELSPQDKIRRMILFAPAMVVPYCLFVKGIIIDGPRGWFYVYQRWTAESLLSIGLMKRLFQKI